MPASQQTLEQIELVNRCMAASMQEKDPDASINRFLEGIGEAVGADRIAVYEHDEEDWFTCTYEWASDGVRVMQTEFSTVNEQYFVLDWWKSILSREPVTIYDMGSYRQSDPHAYQMIVQAKIDRLVDCPIVIEDQLIGFVCFINPAPEWMRAGQRMFELNANYIAVMLRHRRNVDYIYDTEHTDSLTGLESMVSFIRALETTVTAMRSGEELRSLDVVFLNVRDFKEYNIKHGFSGGDALLRRMAGYLRAAVGDGRATRFEADRFYALVDSSRSEKVVRMVHDQMADDLESMALVGAGIYHITGQETDVGQVVDRAKLAADAAYGNYAQYWAVYDPSMQEAMDLRSYVLRHVDEAVHEGWIRAFFQPEVGTVSGKVEGVEALARWIDPELGLLSPDKFIDTLEQARLVYKVDLEILRQVCEFLSGRIAAGLPTVPVSINLSRHDLELEGIHELIDETLERYGVPRRLIRVEITESALAASEDLVREHVAEFHRRGYEVWLDDFGSGYSSLNTLATYGFDCTKLDMLFLRGDGDGHERFLADMVAMSKHMGIKTLCEGVETPEQFQMLKRIGCMMTQGYLFSKPVPAGECERTLASKGYKFITPAERTFYDRIGMVDVCEG